MTEAQERDELARTKTSELINEYFRMSLQWQEMMSGDGRYNGQTLADNHYQSMSLLADEINARMPPRQT